MRSIFFLLLTVFCFAGNRTTLRHIERGGIGYDEGYTSLQFFLASDPCAWSVAPFLDLRGHVFNNGKWAANGGAGMRALWGDRVYGVNAYYDYRNTGRLHANQVGLGLETLGNLWDFRMNGYLPICKKLSTPYRPLFEEFSGHNLLLSQRHHSAMKGSDAEVGFHFGDREAFECYAAAGPLAPTVRTPGIRNLSLFSEPPLDLWGQLDPSITSGKSLSPSTCTP